MKSAKQPLCSAYFSKRLLSWAVACCFLLSTTGCSTIMGFFGSETKVNAAAADDGSRLLVPTVTPKLNLAVVTSEPSPTPTEVPITEAPIEVLPPAQSEPLALPTAAPAPAVTQVVITAPSVNVRSAPSLDGTILRTVATDTTFELIGRNDAGDWYQVCCVDGTQGWVFAELARLDTTNELAAAPAAPAAAPAAPAAAPAALSLAAPVGEAADNVATSSRMAMAELPPATHPVGSLPADATNYVFEDQRITIALPATWKPLITGGQLSQETMVTIGTDMPDVAALVTPQLAKLSQTPLALMAFSVDPTGIASGYLASVTILKQPLPEGIGLDFFLQLSAAQLEQILALPTPIAASNVNTGAGEALLMNYEMADLGVAAQQYMILQAGTVYIITFTSALSQATANAPTFAAIVDSFRVLAE